MGRGRGRWLSMSRAQGAGGRAQMVSLRQQTPAPRAMRPAPSDIYDIIILGGGTAGLVTASGCARLGRRVALIEKAKLGGDCLWTGCVPTKALVASAKLLHQMRHADAFGLEAAQPRVTPRAIMESMRARRREISRHDDPQKFRELGVDAIGIEFAQLFRRFGCDVVVVEMADDILNKEDADVIAAVRTILHDEGVDIRTGWGAKSVRAEGGKKVVRIETKGWISAPAG